MKKIKSLASILAITLLSACGSPQPSSVAFSSSTIVSSNDTSVVINPSSLISSSENNSSNTDSSSEIISSSSSSSSEIYDGSSFYDGYYKDLVSWTNGEDLKNQLNAIIRKGYQALSYTKSSKQNYSTNINADHSKYDFEYLDVIYSEKHTFKTETNKGWQREHAWCASLMCGSTTSNAVAFKGRATDFHNLFAASANGNQSRGNKNYGYANVLDTYYTDRTVDQGNDGYSYDETIFEPADIDKGRLARAIFYMATMYKDEEVDTANNIVMKGLTIQEEPVSYVAGNNCAFAIGHLSDLLEWNEDTPVDYLEMQHNISVYKDKDNPDGYAQGNRNPYVDYPGLADYVYGNKKNQAGSLKDMVASASYLHNEEEGISHYAIKEAKREYGFNEQIQADDYKIVAVNKNYTYEEVSSNITNSLSNHTFVESDGDYIEAKIATPLNEIKYQINLNPMAMCSNYASLSSTGIDTKSHNTEQEITFGEEKMLFTYNTSTASGTAFYVRNISTGGVTLGSNNNQLTGLTIKTKESYTIDRAFIKANAGNTSSTFYLTIKVGDTVLLSMTTVGYNNGNFKIFGQVSETPLTGQVTFIFSGSNAIKLNSIAFNAIIA